MRLTEYPFAVVFTIVSEIVLVAIYSWLSTIVTSNLVPSYPPAELSGTAI